MINVENPKPTVSSLCQGVHEWLSHSLADANNEVLNLYDARPKGAMEIYRRQLLHLGSATVSKEVSPAPRIGVVFPIKMLKCIHMKVQK